MYPRLTEHFEKVKDLVSKKYPGMAGVEINVGCPIIHTRRENGSGRSYMHVDHHPQTVCVHPAAELLPVKNLWGLYLHEFGHLLDPNGEGEANQVICDSFGIRIIYDENMLQFIEGI